jgi:2-methylcitrate dehydratase
LEKQLDYPKGDPRNPLSDYEIEEKFTALAEPVMGEESRRRLADAVWALEELDSVTGLMDLATADR